MIISDVGTFLEKAGRCLLCRRPFSNSSWLHYWCPRWQVVHYGVASIMKFAGRHSANIRAPVWPTSKESAHLYKTPPLQSLARILRSAGETPCWLSSAATIRTTRKLGLSTGTVKPMARRTRQPGSRIRPVTWRGPSCEGRDERRSRRGVIRLNDKTTHCGHVTTASDDFNVMDVPEETCGQPYVQNPRRRKTPGHRRNACKSHRRNARDPQAEDRAEKRTGSPTPVKSVRPAVNAGSGSAAAPANRSGRAPPALAGGRSACSWYTARSMSVQQPTDSPKHEWRSKRGPHEPKRRNPSNRSASPPLEPHAARQRSRYSGHVETRAPSRVREYDRAIPTAPCVAKPAIAIWKSR